MRPLFIVCACPHTGEGFGLSKAGEALGAKEFSAETGLEGFSLSVLSESTRLPVESADLRPLDPGSNGLGDEFGAVVGSCVGRDAFLVHEHDEAIDHIKRGKMLGRKKLKTLPGELVDRCQPFEGAAAFILVEEEVSGQVYSR